MWCSQGDGAGSINQEWSSEQCSEMVGVESHTFNTFKKVSDVAAKCGDMIQVWLCGQQDG